LDVCVPDPHSRRLSLETGGRASGWHIGAGVVDLSAMTTADQFVM
jgi:hypothetical protein